MVLPHLLSLCAAGQVAISDKTISRKHLTIKVDEVPDGGGVRGAPQQLAICLLIQLEAKRPRTFEGHDRRPQHQDRDACQW
jgi:hypothetical protein